MDTSQLEKYAPQARAQLINRVGRRLHLYALAPGAGRLPADAESANGRLFTQREKDQRAAVLRRLQALEERAAAAHEKDPATHAYDALCDEVAYSWFNRVVALRYMEVHDYLPAHVRVFSAPDGSFDPQCLHEANRLDLPGLAPDRAAELMLAGDDEATLRAVLVAECENLAQTLPDVFSVVEASDELLLPDGLMSPDGFIARMVTAIPEETWNDVEVLGWLYQFYIAEPHQGVADSIKKGGKVGSGELAAYTQLFTPDWIVQYMVQNSLGRLWMLNNPSSRLVDHMPFYVAPQGDPGSFVCVSSPEEISVCDPACGSGHILAEAFRLLYRMYEECGYRSQDIPSLILTKNLTGMEIDGRACQFAQITLTLVARAYDRRFFSRGVVPNVVLLEPVAIHKDELPASHPRVPAPLLDALAHLDLCGSLLAPAASDVAALEAARGACSQTLQGSDLADRLDKAVAACRALSRTFDCTIANPPYMGSSNFDPWLSAWTKETYPDTKGDLCTCFIDRLHAMTAGRGFSGLTTSNCWMFLSSYETLRTKLLARSTVETLVQLSVHGFKGVAAQVCTFVLGDRRQDARGGYVRLNDFDHHSLQEQKTLEAIQNPTCGWFYRADQSTFSDIPGTPIAYWASDAMRRAFREGKPLGESTDTHLGMATSDNDRFLRDWWEVAANKRLTPEDVRLGLSGKWYPYNKGGIFRKWYGNDETVVNWENDGEEIRSFERSAVSSDEFFFKSLISWSRVSSGTLAVRYKGPGYLFDMTGPSAFGDEKSLAVSLAFLNSSVARALSRIMSASIDFQPGQIALYPLMDVNYDAIGGTVDRLVQLSRSDWDESETSWDFTSHPLIGGR